MIFFKFVFDVACYVAAGWLAAYALGVEWHRGAALVAAYALFALGRASWGPAARV